MASEASYQSEGTPPTPGRLQTPYNILVLGLVVVAMVMFFVWAYVEIAALGQQTPGPLTAFVWAAMRGSLATLGLCGFLVPGLVLCVRPALFALVSPAPAAASVRRWPRLTGLTLVWAGIGFIAFTVLPLAQVGQVARGQEPYFNFAAAGVTLVVAFVPAYSVMLAGRLVRRRSQRPTAEDGLPSRQSE